MADSMHGIGVNLTRRSQIDPVRQMIEDGSADHVEVLIDNFLSCEPASIRDSLGDIPLSLHIMRSRFLERPAADLPALGTRLRAFIRELQPFAVSDHCARFTEQGLPLAMLAEVDYRNSRTLCTRIAGWQEALDHPLLLENFPSLGEEGRAQPAFFAEAAARCGSGLLFDLSNALIAAHNGGAVLEDWYPHLATVHHLHCGGYSMLDNSPLRIDSHDRPLADDSWQALAQLLDAGRLPRLGSLTLEFDHDIDYPAWRRDLARARTQLAGRGS